MTPPLSPMLAKGEEAIPRREGLLYEPKWDGFRAVCFVNGDDVFIGSRNTQPLLRYFPELAGPLRDALGGDGVVDGEIVIATSQGLDFDRLQLRLHPAESRVRKLAAETPASFIAFDLLARGGADLRGRPLRERRALLEAALVPNDTVACTPQTADPEEAAQWFHQWEGAGLDGIVAKDRDGTYEPGTRGWTKVKHLRTVDVVVGGYRLDKPGTGVASLLLGLYGDEGGLHYVGHTSGFAAAERRALLARLQPMHGESFSGGRAPGGQSRWSKADAEANWNPVRPELVCEVRFDHMQGPRMRHAAGFVRWRDDKSPAECDFSQLQRPEDFDLGTVVTSLARA